MKSPQSHLALGAITGVVVGSPLGWSLTSIGGPWLALPTTALTAAAFAMAVPSEGSEYRCARWLTGTALGASSGFALGWLLLAALCPLTVSILVVSIVAAAASCSCFWVWARRLPVPPPSCRTCGYNLTGNVSGICPECGTPVGPATPST